MSRWRGERVFAWSRVRKRGSLRTWATQNRVVEGGMNEREFWQLSGMSDEDVLRDLKGLVASGGRVDARVVAHLAEVEERRLHLKAATSSLFDYCLRRLGFSESEAFHRITAARLARRFPVIFELLDCRSIHLSALRVLRDHLTSENHRALLAAAAGRSKKEVEVLVAAFAPRPDVPSRIRKLPAQREGSATRRGEVGTFSSLDGNVASRALTSERTQLPCSRSTADVAPIPACPDDGCGESAAGSTSTGVALAGTGRSFQAPVREANFGLTEANAPAQGGELEPESNRKRSGAVRSSAGRGTLEPLSCSRYLVRLCVGCGFKEKLERARDLMSHSNPSSELDAVLERGLDLLLEKLERRRFGRTEPPRTRQETQLEGDALQGEARHSPARVLENGEQAEVRGDGHAKGRAARPKSATGMRRRHIPAEVRRAVAMRDREQCTYEDQSGRRCSSRAFLQLHHERAHALGGPSTFENLRLLCSAHNRLLAERDFGRAHQERCIGKSAPERAAHEAAEAAVFERT
jgi:5-methylcytosine-specific restriction endonuclease McrA